MSSSRVLSSPPKIIVFLYVFLFLLDSGAVRSQEIKQLVSGDSARLVAMYRDLHQNPELGFMETRTAEIIAKELNSLGYQVVTGIAKTGVAGILKNGNGPVVMFRADMDGLPVKEQTGLPYASVKTVKKEDGSETAVMHACGHDAHVTWMLGIAKIMSTKKNLWKGTLVFVAQPAEELGQGAKAMVDDQLYQKGIPVPDYLLGLHTWPIPVGTIQNGYNERFAGTDQLDVTFFGIGGHGSSPDLAKDPIVMASTAVMQYQQIISRQIAPQDAAVITVGSFQSGTANNIIPGSALLKMNMRWFNDKSRSVLLDGIKRVNEGIALANNLPKELYPTINVKATATPLVNDSGLVNKVNLALGKTMDSKDIITNSPSLMVSEDFHYLVAPGNKTVYDYLMIGVANRTMFANAVKKGEKYPFFNHNANYQADLEAIPFGTTVGAVALLELFKSKP